MEELPTAFSEFNTELQGLNDVKLPISASKIKSLTKLAIKCSKNSENVVRSIVEFLRNCVPALKLPGIYVIDSISRTVYKHPEGGASYLRLFEESLQEIIPYLCEAESQDKERMKRAISLWKKSGLFSEEFFEEICRKFPNEPIIDLSSIPYPKKKVQETKGTQDMFNGELTAELLNKVKELQSGVTTKNELEQFIQERPEQMTQLLNVIREVHNGEHPEATLNQLKPVISLLEMSLQNTPGYKPLKSKFAPKVVASDVPFGKKSSDKPSIQSQSEYYRNANGYQMKQGVEEYKPKIRGRADRNDYHTYAAGEDPHGRPIPVLDSDNDGIQSIQSQPQSQVQIAKLQKQGDCIAGYVDPYLSKKYFKVLTRTIYIGGITQNITKEQIRDLLETIARVDIVTVNYPKFNAFVKFLTRAEAELAREYFGDFHWRGTNLKVGWGCGYGPKEYFDYNTGESLFPLNRMTETEKRVISCSSRGGGPIAGGMVVEEPDFGWPQKGEICHGKYANGLVLQAPGYQQALAKCKWNKAKATNYSSDRQYPNKDRLMPKHTQNNWRKDCELQDQSVNSIPIVQTVNNSPEDDSTNRRIPMKYQVGIKRKPDKPDHIYAPVQRIPRRVGSMSGENTISVVADRKYEGDSQSYGDDTGNAYFDGHADCTYRHRNRGHGEIMVLKGSDYEENENIPLDNSINIPESHGDIP